MKRLATIRFSRAFTLLELLVVLGLVVVFAGVVGLSVRGNARGSACLAAQRQLAGLITAGRTHAALAQAEVRLLVSADASDDSAYLSACKLVRAEASGWAEMGVGSVMPAGTALVPPDVSLPADGRRASTAWAGPVDSGLAESATRWRRVYFLRFLPDGRVIGRSDAGPSLLLAVAPVCGSAGGLMFENPVSARGLLVQPGGSVILLDDANID
ncbi:MAG: prepilin-type N-terminal cleavage/methylation domain-containing protein [Opitutaceae bacterium]|jgi:prepilin-type N-terminal cleavage/methylation domain-containing protein|nr:prepilin-type N-terminal cleavage/methylation domain-containing protein [Opitutaceae bacterium]OQB95905.1 MAG: hypothetical protein BWX86_01021 [Verrucomicrobia bacterium ADurb.Bin122]HOD46329.1 prepilin-type N-terminal cleavage/methylation domain-containing protein [Opitutaceae bacterium]HQL20872.1 prepilin-type N-terminal cleavage/methylation domain-containing protein [Opitutaceae bacterium]